MPPVWRIITTPVSWPPLATSARTVLDQVCRQVMISQIPSSMKEDPIRQVG
jgi:hypothetical protein